MGSESSSESGGGGGDGGGDKGGGGRVVEEGPSPLDKDYPSDESTLHAGEMPNEDGSYKK